MNNTSNINADRYAGLNNNQAKAVKMVSGPVMCVAGPGAGKTLTLVRRLAEMLEIHNIEPTGILVVTFTRAAAINMRKRFISKYGEIGSRVNFGTFHSIFFNMLSRSLGYNHSNILDESTAFKIILSILSGRKTILASNPEFVRQVLDEIARFKCSRKEMSEFKTSVISKKDFVDIYNAYEDYLESEKLVDFEDMLNKTWELLTNDSTVLKYWQNKFQYIMVDEFQDINPVQYDIIRLLAAPQNNLFVVGDDDQSIYAFRGALPAIMQQFPSDFPGTRMITLDINYRCSGNILDLAQKLIRNNTVRYEKNLITRNEAGPRVLIKSFKENPTEYRQLAKMIAAEIDSGQNPDNIAVLFRTNAQSAAICQKLIDADVPFKTKGHIPCIYDNRYIAPVLAYIKYLAGDHSRSNFLHIYNKPVRYITRDSLTASEIDIYDLIKSYEAAEKYYVVKNLQKLADDFKIMSHLNTAAAIHYIRKAIGIDDYLKANIDMANNAFEDVMDTLDDLEADAAQFPSFTGYLEHIREYRERLCELNDEVPEAAVNLLTFHGSKGLEYDSVYIPDCVEGVAPHRLSKEKEEIEEERRLFYVAMTRARHKLYLSYSLKRQGKESNVSRFIDEINADRVFAVGQVIYHTRYKEGTILKVEGDALTVSFKSSPVAKRLSAKFCIQNHLLE
jgi:DNA helicase-2/ATP-dependent DNA helicase PcrA